jgi:hypothetical protein
MIVSYVKESEKRLQEKTGVWNLKVEFENHRPWCHLAFTSGQEGPVVI